MEDVLCDSLVVVSDIDAGVFIQDDEAGSVGCADLFVGVVHAGAGVEVEEIAVNEN